MTRRRPRPIPLRDLAEEAVRLSEIAPSRPLSRHERRRFREIADLLELPLDEQ